MKDFLQYLKNWNNVAKSALVAAGLTYAALHGFFKDSSYEINIWRIILYWIGFTLGTVMHRYSNQVKERKERRTESRLWTLGGVLTYFLCFFGEYLMGFVAW